MDEGANFTPLNTGSISVKKVSSKRSKKVLIGLIFLFVAGIAVIGYLLTKERIQTQVPAQIGPTLTETPTPTTEQITASPSAELTISPTEPVATASPTITEEPTFTPSLNPTDTPIPVACGTKSCDSTTNPCRSGLICIQANDGSNYCSLPEFHEACKADPSQTSCCTASGNSPTPTEILLVQTTSTPEGTLTPVAQVSEIPTVGVATFGKILLGVSVIIIFIGLLL